MTRVSIAIALCALLALSAVPAAAANGDCRLIRGQATPETTDDVQVCHQDNWIHQADNKVSNVATALPSWNTTAPTASVTSGAGGGTAALAVAAQQNGRHNPQNDATFQGTFTGNIDTMAWSLYLFTTARQADPTQAVALRLTVDGKVLYQTADTADRTPLASGGNAVQRTDFGFTNVHAAMEKAGITLGDGITHTVRLSVSNWFSVNDNAAYVYDTTEVPSGVSFNANGPFAATFKL